MDRKGQHPSAHLSGDTGTVHADGLTGFNGLFGEGLATGQACMVHVRRKFVEVFERDGSVIARGAIEDGVPRNGVARDRPRAHRRAELVSRAALQAG